MDAREHVFTRTLGRAPRRGKPRGSTTDQLGLFVESFGPPEIRTHNNQRTLFWNFLRNDGLDGFSLISDVSGLQKPTVGIGRLEVHVRLVAGSGVKSFREWTASRLFRIETGKETPAFLDGPHFVIRRVQ